MSEENKIKFKKELDNLDLKLKDVYKQIEEKTTLKRVKFEVFKSSILLSIALSISFILFYFLLDASGYSLDLNPKQIVIYSTLLGFIIGVLGSYTIIKKFLLSIANEAAKSYLKKHPNTYKLASASEKEKILDIKAEINSFLEYKEKSVQTKPVVKKETIGDQFDMPFKRGGKKVVHSVAPKESVNKNKNTVATTKRKSTKKVDSE